MNRLKGSTLALAFCTIALGGYSQEKKEEAAKPDTLKLSVVQAQQYALDNNRSILNANIDIEMAKKKVWETTAIGLPQVSGKGSFTYTPTLSPIISEFTEFTNLPLVLWNINNILKVNEQPSPPTSTTVNLNDYKWNLTGDISVNQLIFSGSYLVGLQSAKVYKSLSELSQVKSKQDVLESVVNSYFNVLIAHENKSILDSTYQNLLKTLSDTKALGNNGFVEETDIDQLQITVSNVKISLDFITRQQDIAEKLLKLQLGIDLNKPLVLTDELNALIEAMTYDKILMADFVVDDNINYKMLDAQVKVNALILKLHKSEFLPDLSAFYQFEHLFNPNALVFSSPNTIGVTLNVPIFSSGARMSRVGQARLDLEKAKNTRDQNADAIKLDFYTSKSALQNSLDNYHTESSNIHLAKKIYDRAMIKYVNGVISSTDLTTIQNQYLTAQSNYYTAIQNLVTSKNKLEKMLTKGEYNK
jgi:outer membrane protein TolC